MPSRAFSQVVVVLRIRIREERRINEESVAVHLCKHCTKPFIINTRAIFLSYEVLCVFICVMNANFLNVYCVFTNSIDVCMFSLCRN
jgi:hypothetical protein